MKSPNSAISQNVSPSLGHVMIMYLTVYNPKSSESENYIRIKLPELQYKVRVSQQRDHLDAEY